MKRWIDGELVEMTPEEVAEFERMATEYTEQEQDEPVTWAALADAIKNGVNDV